MQFVLYGVLIDKDTRKLVLPFNILAGIIGINYGRHGFSAKDWMERFSRDVLPLNPSEYNYVLGRARTIDPEIPNDILSAIQYDTETRDNSDWVWFIDGTAVSRRGYQDVLEEHEKYLINLVDSVDEKHPAKTLLKYLRNQPQDTLLRILKRNWSLVQEAVIALPQESPKEIATREYCFRLLNELRDF